MFENTTMYVQKHKYICSKTTICAQKHKSVFKNTTIYVQKHTTICVQKHNYLCSKTQLCMFKNTTMCFQKHNYIRSKTQPNNQLTPCTIVFIVNSTTDSRGRDSSVGIATRYRLDDLGIESWWGREFPYPSRPALGHTQPPIQWVPGHSRGQSA
jgi:hypothetical protein